MEIRVGIAKVGKYGTGVSGDSVEVVERPRGGVSIVIVDGQGHGAAAKRTSHMVAAKASSLIGDGARDGAVMRAISDFLYAQRDGKVSSTVTILSADLDHKSLVISRNTNSPVIIGHGDGSSCLDAEVNPIGVHRLNRPAISHWPLFPGTVLVGFTDGVTHAGRYHGGEFELGFVYQLLQSGTQDAQELADEILHHAIELDKGRPADDMVAAVLAIAPCDRGLGIRRMTVHYPF
ncbi:MAG: serine/threonine-protein phosphatase [Firmicutes bacterium]|nr:serine/threonine-protein phosphatase [Bacillota bacterium]